MNYMKLKIIKPITFNMMKIYYIIVVLMYFCALMLISCCVEYFADFTTALYWFSEVMNAANRVLFIGVMTCVSVQLLC